MNNRTFAKRVIAKWVERLELSHWLVRLRLYKRLDLDEQYCAWSKSEAVARIGLNVAMQPQDEIEHCAAHELAHLIESPQNLIFDNLVETYVPKSERTGWENQYNLAQNESIEHWLRIVYRAYGETYPPHREEKETP